MTPTAQLALLCSLAIAAQLAVNAPAKAQSAPVPFLLNSGAFGLDDSGSSANHQAALDDDGFRKGFSFRGFSAPVSSVGSSFGLAGIGAGFAPSGLTSEGAQYGYSFRGVGDLPVTLFGSVNALRANPDVFTSLVTPGFSNGATLASSVNAGIELKPASNISLSLSAGFVQTAPNAATDLRTQMLGGWR
jgi:hypothetical protein